MEKRLRKRIEKERLSRKEDKGKTKEKLGGKSKQKG